MSRVVMYVSISGGGGGGLAFANPIILPSPIATSPHCVCRWMHNDVKWTEKLKAYIQRRPNIPNGLA